MTVWGRWGPLEQVTKAVFDSPELGCAQRMTREKLAGRERSGKRLAYLAIRARVNQTAADMAKKVAAGRRGPGEDQRPQDLFL
ncbi:hypothetical protein NDU88_008409 [Pleurodeles waltl]|uniref:Uncharacterized protein n=1 Tax=Pleurodeles waltl TaxID=8319 RepID=A0AAV7RW06_PLEWA|nr:hypothetical protein NDU88_008409 [Pleurodeles waltl]